ncbi:hypothetical protein RRG08_031162 [Elysia crispata]|uniref:Uncharacterized protein n=1 Tax=Elysia crispata TaxID=231223 RepID=A0AAE1DF39_9GAST|nr:hypothetical protein RRG08_031162 [Elysia crispata]
MAPLLTSASESPHSDQALDQPASAIVTAPCDIRYNAGKLKKSIVSVSLTKDLGDVQLIAESVPSDDQAELN